MGPVPCVGPLVWVFDELGADGILAEAVSFFLQGVLIANAVFEEAFLPVDALGPLEISLPGRDNLFNTVLRGVQRQQRVEMIGHEDH